MRWLLLVLWFAVLTVSDGALAAYPDRPVRIIVPYSPGGSYDMAARLIAQELQKRLNQPFIVDNRPGASANIGADAAAKASADGYTLLVMGVPHVINKSLFKQLPYDLTRDLVPVATISAAPMVLLAGPSENIRSVADLVEVAKAKPGMVAYGSSGSGSAPHLAMSMLALKTGISLLHVPYKGSSPQTTDLIAGRIAVAFDSIVVGQEWASSGRLRALAVTGDKRSPVLPEVPTMAESGFPEISVKVWYGLAAPSKTPSEVIELLNVHVRAILDSPQVQKQLGVLGAEPLPMTPHDFAQFLQSEIAKWGDAVRASGVELE